MTMWNHPPAEAISLRHFFGHEIDLPDLLSMASGYPSMS